MSYDTKTMLIKCMPKYWAQSYTSVILNGEPVEKCAEELHLLPEEITGFIKHAEEYLKEPVSQQILIDGCDGFAEKLLKTPYDGIPTHVYDYLKLPVCALHISDELAAMLADAGYYNIDILLRHKKEVSQLFSDYMSLIEYALYKIGFVYGTRISDMVCPNSPEHLVARATKDMFALIIPESWEMYARRHLKEIVQLYPCSGVLIQQDRGGRCYHMTRDQLVPEIERNGLLPSNDDTRTFGGDVIYCYPHLMCYAKLAGPYTLYQIDYSRCLRSIYKEDAAEYRWEEVLVRPEDIVEQHIYCTGSSIFNV